MKSKFTIFLFVLGISLIAQAQSPLREVVKIEQAFSKMAEEKTTRGSYVRIWQKQGDAWRVVLDITNAH